MAKARALTFIVMLFLLSMISQAQGSNKNKPFSFTFLGVTFTGTYSEGYMYRHTVNGTNILWGLISWGGSETIECRPGNAPCKIETILTVGKVGFKIDNSGQKGFDIPFMDNGVTPLIVTADDKKICFAVDLNLFKQEDKTIYTNGIFELKNAFVLSPEVVRTLKLYSGDEDKGFIIPAGAYQLYQDGNIVFWNFEFPEK